MHQLLKLIIITFLLSINSVTCFAQTKPIRVVSLSPALTDSVIELGGADLLVGVLDYQERRPDVIAHIPSVGKFGQFSLEKLIAVKPDLILVWPTSIKPAEQQQLTKLGYKIIVSNPHTLDELATQIALIGKQIDRAREGDALAAKMRAELTDLRKKYYRVKPLRVFYQIWGQPIYTIGKGQIIGDALNTCGAQNIFDDIETPAPIVNIEAILARNPEVIVASQQNLLDTWQNWPTLTAVQQQNLLLFNNQNIARPNFAMLEATQQLCELLSHY